MLNLKKIIKLVLIAAFMCVMQMPQDAYAMKSFDTIKIPCGPCTCHQGQTCVQGSVENGNICRCEGEIDTCLLCEDDEQCVTVGGTKACTKKSNTGTPSKSAGSNAQQSTAAVTGCSGDLGLFSGLVNAGREIFNGLRDLIYVVAGFGIIGVAVGGFFGNMNWKWLGAIVISLVIIATTGELITAITGCESYTSAVIQDTLK